MLKRAIFLSLFVLLIGCGSAEFARSAQALGADVTRAAPDLAADAFTADGLWARYVDPSATPQCQVCHQAIDPPVGRTARDALVAGHPEAELPPAVDHVLRAYAVLATAAARAAALNPRATASSLIQEIHLEKGMHCIDCHFYQDDHGDGNLYAR